jgi:hypothetical protein
MSQWTVDEKRFYKHPQQPTNEGENRDVRSAEL